MNRAQKRAAAFMKGSEKKRPVLFNLTVDRDEATVLEEALAAYILSIEVDGGDLRAKGTAERLRRALEKAVGGRVTFSNLGSIS